MKIKEIVAFVVVGFLVALFVMGGLALWYTIDTTQYCRKHEEANPNINFEWKFSTGCIFELPDGTWISLGEYKNQDEYKLEIEK